MLKEETTINEIRSTVVQAGVDFDASQLGDEETRLEGAKTYLSILDKAVSDVGEWEPSVESQNGSDPNGSR